MYTLYYLNDNYTFGTLEVPSLDVPITIPQNLIFTNLRKGIHFIKEPHKCIDFTDFERLIMSTEFFDMETIKQADFRKANSFLNPLCQIDVNVPLFFNYVGSDSAEWIYPDYVQVFASNTQFGQYSVISSAAPSDRFFNKITNIPSLTEYWVKLYDPERELFSNPVKHWPAE
ncbi:hypothetical protein [Flavobacterium sp. ov086]|uniref:hypothetical protein n=1 Tax=Flavobacterium sp. ov086 TaxID=1761785 RepID=UPI000B732B06|nr:hypothetical protein [Flavobacterium sp. ov086]SNS02625.1 hypothetical protein SAMN04487979_14520 [Flavobacterium sp. ov086]